MKSISVLLAAFVAVAAAGCGSGDGAARPAFDPAGRAVRIESVGCEFASDRTGSGVAVGDGLVVTVAHLVARADRVVASVAGGEAVDAAVAAFDPTLDLALLQLPDNDVPDVETATARAGERGVIVGGAGSGDLPFRITEPVSISIEEVLGTDRHSRLGYEVDVRTTGGDSGAGAFDEEGRLLGIVFATSADGGASWLTSSIEIERFLEAGDRPHSRPGCRD